MKVLRLEVKNTLGIEALEIEPQGNVIEIRGKNGVGKSSALDAMWMALTGRQLRRPQPVREGAEQARVTVELGDDKAELIVTAKWGKGQSLTVENADGARFRSPQKMLDALFDGLSIEAMRFASLSAREQYETLLQIVDVGIDLEEHERKRREIYDKRREINRDLKQAQARFDALDFEAKTLPDAERVDVSALLARRRQMEEENRQADELQAQAAQHRAAAERQREAVAEAEQRVAELERQLAEAKAELADRRRDEEAAARMAAKAAEAAEKAIRHDLSEIDAEIEAAMGKNRIADEGDRLRREREDAEQEVKALERKSKQLTERLQQHEAEKEAALRKAEAQMPYPGLGIGDGCVTLDGIPLEQCSKSERIAIGLAIPAARNPKLRVVRIENATELDSETRAAVLKWAADHDYQVWEEIVTDDPEVTIRFPEEDQ